MVKVEKAKTVIKIYYDSAMTRDVRLGYIRIYDDDEHRIGCLIFTVQETQINIDDMVINKKYRRRGFGRLLMKVVMALAEELKKPLFLFATDKSIGFYEHLGLLRLFYWGVWRNGITVEFMNLNPDKPFADQCSNEDFVWIPHGLNHIQIYL